MKIIKYYLAVKTNMGTKEEPVWEVSKGGRVKLRCSESNLEANEAIAKREAYNGEYTIEDDGLPDPETPEAEDLTADEMAAAILEGVNEV